MATEVPESSVTTAALMDALGDRMSPELRKRVAKMGIDVRHSVLDNLIDRYVESSDVDSYSTCIDAMASRAAQSAIDEVSDRLATDAGPSIGLLIAATNTQSRVLPGFAYEVGARLGKTLSPDVQMVNAQGMGCSVLIKAFDIARWYLSAHPERLALIVAAEAATPYFSSAVPPVMHRAYSEVPDQPDEKYRTTSLMQRFLFGDGAVAVVIGGDQLSWGATLGPTAHSTNVSPGDIDLLTMTAGGSLLPEHSGRGPYTMSADVARTGAAYAASTIEKLRATPSGEDVFAQASEYLIHTGSKKIIRGVCASLGVEQDDPRTDVSYEILRKYGNMSAASLGFMMAENANPTCAVLVSFGVGFSASATWLTA